jgi:excisionase family DNA binding protein
VVTQSPSRPLDVREAAERLGVSVRWIRSAVYHRRLRYYKLGGLLRFDPSDLDEFLRRARVEPRPRSNGGAQ